MIKTVSLTAGTETKVEISGGYNVGVINRTTNMLYASRNSGIVAGADDVAAIPAGDSYVIRAADDTVYLLATAAGDVQLESLGAKEVFKVAAARSSSGGGEGGTVDEVARQAIASHANNEDIHLTAEKAIEAAATSISNPNLLINPDFKINQRGQTEYIGSNEKSIYTVDGWKILQYSPDIKVTVNDGYITLENSGDETQYVAQSLENPIDDAHTISAKILGSDNVLSGTKVMTDDFTIIYERANNWLAIHIAAHTAVSLEWVKMEHGSVATPFVPPHPATELVKCQRYFEIITIPAKTPIIGVKENDLRLPTITYSVPKRIDTPTILADETYPVRFSDNAGVFGALVKKAFTGFYCTSSSMTGYFTDEQENKIDAGQMGYIADPVNIIIDAEL